MLEESVTVVNHLGLHARAAGQLVKLAGQFESRLVVKRFDGTAEAEACSMLDILTLGASVGTVLTIHAEGRDESAAITAVKQLFESGFGEI